MQRVKLSSRTSAAWSSATTPIHAVLVVSLAIAPGCESSHAPLGDASVDASDADTGPSEVETPARPDASPDASGKEDATAEDDGIVEDGGRVVDSTELTGTVAVPPECSLPEDCVPIETSVLNMPVCCRETTPCGYVFSTTAQTLTDFPDAVELAESLWDDGCVPRTFVFSSQPGIDSYRVPVEDGEDILVDETCEFRNFWAWPLPGCCMPNNECGISTDESYPVLENLLESGESAPFAMPECVSAADLNQQLRDSSLKGMDFIPDTTGTCDYAALAAALP